MDTLRGIESFVRSVETGSIAAAARLLGISAAAASQNIARLEAQLEARLLIRTTRSLGLTDSGTIYYDKVRSVVRDLEDANAAVTALHSEPQGRLRIASTAAFGRHVLAPMVPMFNTRYPKVLLEILTTDRSVDHIQESVDISIRIKQQLEEGMVARKIATVPFRFCASSAYLKRAGRPDSLEDLRNHECLVFRVQVDGRILRWGYVRNGQRFEVEVRAAIIADDIDVLAQLAVAGGGVARLAAFVADSLIERGELEELFIGDEQANTAAQTDIEPLDLYLCVRDRHELTPKVRAFTESLLAILPPTWRPKGADTQHITDAHTG